MCHDSNQPRSRAARLVWRLVAAERQHRARRPSTTPNGKGASSVAIMHGLDQRMTEYDAHAQGHRIRAPSAPAGFGVHDGSAPSRRARMLHQNALMLKQLPCCLDLERAGTAPPPDYASPIDLPCSTASPRVS